MKIALLSYEYPPETGFGGIGTYTWHHARALARLGHDVHVLAGARHQTPLGSDMQDGVHVHRFWAGGATMAALGAVPFAWTRQRLQNAWSMYQGLSLLHARFRYDVIEMPECGAEGAFITRRLDVPSVVRLHSPAQLIMPFYDVSSADEWLCPAVEQRAMTRATAITACSTFLAAEAERSLGLRPRPVVVTNGLDLDWFDRTERVDVHGQYALPREVPVILFTGRMERRKGIHLCTAIAEAILPHHQVAFVLAGADPFNYVQGTLLPRLAGRALKGSIHWLDAVSQNNLRALVRAADVFVSPSLWENCPYSCLEAMAASRAVVAADQGGMPELIQDGVNGVLVTMNDATGFARAIEALLGNASRRAALGAAARATIARAHTSELVATQTLSVYERAAGR